MILKNVSLYLPSKIESFLVQLIFVTTATDTQVLSPFFFICMFLILLFLPEHCFSQKNVEIIFLLTFHMMPCLGGGVPYNKKIKQTSGKLKEFHSESETITN